MFKLSAILLSVTFSFAANSSLACQVNTANIVGLGAGAEFDEITGVCYVDVEISSVRYNSPQCRLAVQKDQVVRIQTSLSKEECPLDEVKVRGTLIDSGRSVYMFSGQIL